LHNDNLPLVKSENDQSRHLQHNSALCPITKSYFEAIPQLAIERTNDDYENKQDRIKRAERLQISSLAKYITIKVVNNNE